ncbi:MAG TPA: iron-containing alcohol dehydrogenase [Fibrobacteria bacterium]|nr:iron-containing alcohol dehydrogenase [Fibrobacteria bacterium]
MVTPPFTFARIPHVHFGAGKLADLPRVAAGFGTRALLITGASSLKAGGRLERVHEGLRRAGIRFETLIIDAEPSTEFIDATCARLKGPEAGAAGTIGGAGNAGVEMVIGIGGGSVIDGAKAISAMLPHANSVLDHLEDVGRNVAHSGVKIPYVAVPTTSGTGGEMTKNAVLSMVGPEGYKKSLRHDNLIPDAVIVDPELMLTCPPRITAACGMDAFTQLLEPYLSPIASPLTDALAFSGLEKIRDNLVPACTDKGGDVAVRAGMAYASMLSGVALANAGLGIVHGLASPIGGFFPIPHGVVCGTLVASATESNLAALRKRGGNPAGLAKYARVGALLGGDAGKSDAWNGDHLVDTLRAWTSALALPRLGAYGVSAADLDRIVDKTSNRHNPVKLERDELLELLARRL